MDPFTGKTIQEDQQNVIEKLMRLDSSNETYNVSSEILKTAGDLYVYLNICPDTIKYSMMRIELEQLVTSGKVVFLFN